jgi:hypothetical protein
MVFFFAVESREIVLVASSSLGKILGAGLPHLVACPRLSAYLTDIPGLMSFVSPCLYDIKRQSWE